MESKQILLADVLDIVFEGRNKAYGAYQLRKTYNRRLAKAMLGTAAVVGLFFGGYVLANSIKPAARTMVVDADKFLEAIPEKERPEPVKPLPPPEKLPEQSKSVKLFTPIITSENIPETEMPPADVIEDAKIGDINNLNGQSDDGIVAPPGDGADKGIIEKPEKRDDVDGNGVFLRVEKESEYPGGMGAWTRYLNKNLSNNYPEAAQEAGIQGTVLLRFVVDADGTVSNVEAVSGPEELRAVAIATIKKSGKWIPALQNGNYVKSYKKQPITFKLQDE